MKYCYYEGTAITFGEETAQQTFSPSPSTFTSPSTFSSPIVIVVVVIVVVHFVSMVLMRHLPAMQGGAGIATPLAECTKKVDLPNIDLRLCRRECWKKRYQLSSKSS